MGTLSNEVNFCATGRNSALPKLHRKETALRCEAEGKQFERNTLGVRFVGLQVGKDTGEGSCKFVLEIDRKLAKTKAGDQVDVKVQGFIRGGHLSALAPATALLDLVVDPAPSHQGVINVALDLTGIEVNTTLMQESE